jgi:MFS family permease
MTSQPSSIPPPPSSIIGWCVFIIGAVFYSYEFLLRILPSVMTTELMQAHRLTTAGFGYVMVVYYIVYTIMQLPVGVLIDKYGPRKLLLFASATCAFGSFLFASESSVALVAIGRFLVGLGSAFGFVGVLRIASLWLPPRRFALATGLVTSLGMMGGVLGEVILSYVIDSAGWHRALILSAWVGLVLLMVFWLMPEHITSSSDTHHSVRQWRVVLQQLHRIVRMPVIWLNGLAGGLLYAPLAVFAELWGVSYLQTAQNLTRVEATFAVSCLMWGWAVGAPLIGWFADRTGGRHRIVLCGSALASVVIVYLIQHPLTAPMMLYPILFFFGLFCSVQILMMVFVRDICPHDCVATGLSFTNMLIMIGGMLFQPAVGVLLKSYTQVLIDNPTSSIVLKEYSRIMYIVPATILLAMIVIIIQISSSYLKIRTSEVSVK